MNALPRGFSLWDAETGWSRSSTMSDGHTQKMYTARRGRPLPRAARRDIYKAGLPADH